jgi:hypothetical protein
LTISGPTAERLARLLERPVDPTATAKPPPRPQRGAATTRRAIKFRKGPPDADEPPAAVPADELLPGFSDRFHEVFDARGRTG